MDVPQEEESLTEDNNNIDPIKDAETGGETGTAPGVESQFGGSSVFIRDSEDEGDSVDAVPYVEDIETESKNVEEQENGVKEEVDDSEIRVDVEEEIVIKAVELDIGDDLVEKESVNNDKESDDSEHEEIEESDVINTSLENILGNDQSQDNMPGREDEVLSPSLQKATCRYRWGKTIRTNSRDVVFFPSYKMVRLDFIDLQNALS